MLTKLVVVCLLGFAYELASGVHTLALVRGRIALAALISFLCPLLALLDLNWMIEADDLWQRALLAAATAVGCGIGTVVAVKWKAET